MSFPVSSYESTREFVASDYTVHHTYKLSLKNFSKRVQIIGLGTVTTKFIARSSAEVSDIWTLLFPVLETHQKRPIDLQHHLVVERLLHNSSLR